MHADTLIRFYRNTEPRRVIEMDEATLQYARILRDASGEFLWTPELKYPDMPGKLFGIPINVVKCPHRIFRIGYLFPDGHRHVIDMDV